MANRSTVTHFLQNPDEVLRKFFVLYILRRHSKTMTYKDMERKWPDLFGDLEIDFTAVTSGGKMNDRREHVRKSVNMRALLSGMKINMEADDFCTTLQQDICQAVLGDSPKRRLPALTTVALSMVFFGSRVFLTKLKDAVNSPAWNFRTRTQCVRNIAAIVTATQSPAELFTRSFCPNRIRFRQIKKSTKPHKQCRKLWFALAKKTRNFSLKLSNQFYKSKKKVASEWGRRIGAFSGKNMYQILKRALVQARFRGPGFRSTSDADAMYSETGPGARAGLNLLSKFPTGWSALVTGQAAADVYSTTLIQWLLKWRNMKNELKKALPEELHCHVEFFTNYHTFDECDFQFALCELSKVISFLLHQNKIYLRGYWSSVGGYHDEEDESWFTDLLHADVGLV